MLPPSMSCAKFSSAVNLFVQLTARRSPQPIVLEFLLPRIATRAFGSHIHIQTPKRARRPQTTTAAWCIQRQAVSSKTGRSSNRAVRSFSSTPTRSLTQAIYNPQKDDDGNDMMMEITPRAAKRLSEIMTKDSNPNLALRIQVESGGCHGFQYLMSLVTLPPSLPSAPAEPTSHPGEGADSGTIREDDTIFTFSPEEQIQTNLTAPKIILDQPSLDLLKGSKVDYTMELIGSQFKITDNPSATSSCGCGTSFDVKI